jgi:5'-methylthioadenosine phosphorylase
MVIDNLRANAALAQQIVRMTAERLAAHRIPSGAHHALRHALMTPKEEVPPATRRRTNLFTAPYWGNFR